jgi:SAM-dependent methyltransferase
VDPGNPYSKLILLSEAPMPSKTTEFYNRTARDFSDDTLALDMSEFYARFLPKIPPGGRILDVGCGPGRDSKFFLEKGFEVTALDPSEEMVRMASEFTGIEVLQFKAEEINFHSEFDGIWCCASLLHVPQDEILPVLENIKTALKPNGILYCSFKYGGDHSRIKGDRLFNDQTEDSFKKLLKQIPELQSQELWVTNDIRPGREEEQWLNCLISAQETRKM